MSDFDHVAIIFLQASPVVDEASPSSASSFEMLDMESAHAPYQEVQPHWFFCRRADDNTSWLPFSREDSDKLENAFTNSKNVFYLYVIKDTVYLNYYKWIVWGYISRHFSGPLLTVGCGWRVRTCVCQFA